MKNSSAFASTGGPELFTNKKLAMTDTIEKSYSYAHIPMKKDIPQWNISSAVLRNSSSLYTIPKDSRFK